MLKQDLFKAVYCEISRSKCNMGRYFDKKMKEMIEDNNIAVKNHVADIIKINDYYLEYFMVFQAVATTNMLIRLNIVHVDNSEEVNLNNTDVVNSLVKEILPILERDISST